MKKLVAAAVAMLAVGMSASAFATTLSYDFAMTVTQISDATEPGYTKGIFASAGITQGSTLNVSANMDTTTNTAQIQVKGLDISATNPWSSSWVSSWTQPDGTVWHAGPQTGGALLTVNGVNIPSGSATETLWLLFAPSSGSLSSGSWLDIKVNNSVNARLHAEYTGKPVSTPELDPSSGAAALALLFGGTTIVFSSRSRRQGSRS